MLGVDSDRAEKERSGCRGGEVGVALGDIAVDGVGGGDEVVDVHVESCCSGW